MGRTSTRHARSSSRWWASPVQESPRGCARWPRRNRSPTHERRGRRQPELPPSQVHPRAPDAGGAAPGRLPVYRGTDLPALAGARPSGPESGDPARLPRHARGRRNVATRRAHARCGPRAHADSWREPRSCRVSHDRHFADARLGARCLGAAGVHHGVASGPRSVHRGQGGKEPRRAGGAERRGRPQGRGGSRHPPARFRGRRRSRSVLGRRHCDRDSDGVYRVCPLGRGADRRAERRRHRDRSDLPAHARRAAARGPLGRGRDGRADSPVERGCPRLIRRPGRHHHARRGAAGGEARRTAGRAGAARARRLLRAHAQEAELGRPLRPRATVVLTELRVRDLAVIADVTLSLTPGLNVLTGETGAGKSMLVDALALLLGERASSDMVRPGASKTVIEGAFEFTSTVLHRLSPSFTALGVEAEDGRLVLKREVSGEGRSRAWVNGSPTTVGVLAQLGALLVDLHGQHETQSLLRADAQRDILDSYADALVERTAVRDAHDRLHELERREQELTAAREEVRRKADYLRHVVEEIEKAAPRAGEVDALELESKRLAHADELGRLSRELEQAIDTGGLSRAAKLFAALTRLDPSPAVAKWQELLDGAFAHLEELAQAARDYAAAIESDPQRLGAVEQRRDVLFRLTQKYGPALPDVLATRDRAARELELLDTADLDLRQIAAQRETAAADFARACAALTARRTKGAAHLASAVNELLPALGMEGGRFAARLVPLPAARSHGAEDVVFEVQ